MSESACRRIADNPDRPSRYSLAGGPAAVRAIFRNLVLDRQSSEGLASQIHTHVREQIELGLLSPGQRLETSRRLAQHLGCSRNVVLEAIDALVADGYLASAPRSSVHVSHNAPLLADGRVKPQLVPLDDLHLSGACRNLPTGPTDRLTESRLGTSNMAFPYPVWAAAYRRVWKDPRRVGATDGTGADDPRLLGALAAYLQVTRGIACTPDNLMLFENEALASQLIAQVLLERGEHVWMETAGFCRISSAFALAGADVARMPSGPDGLAIDKGQPGDLRRDLRGRPARLVVTSAPWCSLAAHGADRETGRQLLEWARRTNGWILERGCHGDIRSQASAIPSLKALDGHGHVLHLGSLAPALLPQMGVTFLIARPDLIAMMRLAREASQGQPSSHLLPVLSDFMNEGHFARHALKVVRACERARAPLENFVGTSMARHLATPLRHIGHLLLLELAEPSGDRAATARASLLADFCRTTGGTALLSDALDGPHPREGLLLNCLDFDLAAARRNLPALAAALDEAERPRTVVTPFRDRGSTLPQADLRPPAGSRLLQPAA